MCLQANKVPKVRSNNTRMSLCSERSQLWERILPCLCWNHLYITERPSLMVLLFRTISNFIAMPMICKCIFLYPLVISNLGLCSVTAGWCTTLLNEGKTEVTPFKNLGLLFDAMLIDVQVQEGDSAFCVFAPRLQTCWPDQMKWNPQHLWLVFNL